MEWLNKNWHVSPWNYDKNVTACFDLPKCVKFTDTTLRDGEQAAGVQFSFDQKLVIAEKLMEAGVDRIEACMPVVSKEDERVLTEIVKRNYKKCEISAFCRAAVRDVTVAADCGAKIATIEIPVGEAMLAIYGWDEETAVEKAVTAISLAKERGMYVNLFMMDGSRADLDNLVAIAKKIYTQVHFDAISIVDTYGVAHPEAIKSAVQRVKKEFVGLDIEVHCHEDYGLGVATTLAAVTCGVDMVHTTIGGLGARAGGAPMEEIVMALEALYGVKTNIDISRLRELAIMVSDFSGVPIHPNKAIVGEKLFVTEAGIPVMIIRNNKKNGLLPREAWPYDPACVNAPSSFVLGKSSGEHSIRAYTEDMGIPLTDKEIKQVLGNVKDQSIKLGRLLDLDDFRRILFNVHQRDAVDGK